MKNMYEEVTKWVKEGNGRRAAKIELGYPDDADYVEVWIYDFDLERGKFVKSTDDIKNFYTEAEEQEKEIYERLKKKFEEE